jgi:transposase-like protein
MYPQSIQAKNDPKKVVKKPLKNCPNCGSNSISKNGFRGNLKNLIQRFKCKECSHRFQPSKRPTQKAAKLAHEYLFKNSLWVRWLWVIS